MGKRDIWYLLGFVVLAGLLLANLWQPVTLQAFDLPAGGSGAGASVAVAGDAQSAWVVRGDMVYYLTLRPRADVANRTITVIADEKLR